MRHMSMSAQLIIQVGFMEVHGGSCLFNAERSSQYKANRMSAQTSLEIDNVSIYKYDISQNKELQA